MSRVVQPPSTSKNGVNSNSNGHAPKSNGGTPKPLRAPPPIPAEDYEEEDSSEYEYETDDEEVEEGNDTTAAMASRTYEEHAENILENADNPSLDYIDDENEESGLAVVTSPKRKKKQTFISGTIDIDILLGEDRDLDFDLD